MIVKELTRELTFAIINLTINIKNERRSTMSNEPSIKNLTLSGIKKESKAVRQYANVIFWICGVWVIICTIILLIGLLGRRYLTRIVLDPSQNTLIDRIVYSYVMDFTNQQPLNSSGAFRIVQFSINILEQIIPYGLACYVARSIKAIFSSIEQGESPFTKKAVEYCKRCAKRLATLTSAWFTAALFLKEVSCAPILLIALASSFFQAFALIFEYGSCLQIESDETL